MFKKIIPFVLFVLFFSFSSAHAQQTAYKDDLQISKSSIEVVGADDQRGIHFFGITNKSLSTTKGGSDIEVVGIENGLNLIVDFRNDEPVELKQFNLNIEFNKNSFDSYYRIVAGKWEKFELKDSFFFGQELILYNTEESAGVLLIFNDPYGRLFLSGDLLKINFLDGRTSSVKNIHSSIYLFPVSNPYTYKNIIYKSKFPDGKDQVLIYSADDLHAVFGEDFIDRLKFFKELKKRDPSFKTTLLVVADVWNRRNELLNNSLIGEIKKLGFIKFGFHGVYHSYPVDDPINPQLFDQHFVDFSGGRSDEIGWLNKVISKGINILKAQGFDYSVFRAPQYRYTSNAVSVLSESNVHLIHVCQNDVYNPIRFESENGWLYKVYDSPCDRGFVKTEDDKKIYNSMNFKKELALNGKETSFHVHIWELWSGENPYDGNAMYFTFDKLVQFLSFLETRGIDYNWQYAEDYYRYLDSLNTVSIKNTQSKNNIITADLLTENTPEINIYLKLPLVNGQFIKSAFLNGRPIKFSQSKLNLAVLEIPKNSLRKSSSIKIELTNNVQFRQSNYVVKNPPRDLDITSIEHNTNREKEERKSDVVSLTVVKNETSTKFNFNTLILVGLFAIYTIIFSAGLFKYFKSKKNA